MPTKMPKKEASLGTIDTLVAGAGFVFINIFQRIIAPYCRVSKIDVFSIGMLLFITGMLLGTLIMFRATRETFWRVLVFLIAYCFMLYMFEPQHLANSIKQNFSALLAIYMVTSFALGIANPLILRHVEKTDRLIESNNSVG